MTLVNYFNRRIKKNLLQRIIFYCGIKYTLFSSRFDWVNSKCINAAQQKLDYCGISYFRREILIDIDLNLKVWIACGLASLNCLYKTRVSVIYHINSVEIYLAQTEYVNSLDTWICTYMYLHNYLLF